MMKNPLWCRLSLALLLSLAGNNNIHAFSVGSSSATSSLSFLLKATKSTVQTSIQIPTIKEDATASQLQKQPDRKSTPPIQLKEENTGIKNAVSLWTPDKVFPDGPLRNLIKSGMLGEYRTPANGHIAPEWAAKPELSSVIYRTPANGHAAPERAAKPELSSVIYRLPANGHAAPERAAIMEQPLSLLLAGKGI
eukprot:CAMPEP_0198143148 /NCGR_PEP_ID=MMETSP1443-20131203/5906_1 /TAXON_ID=186043 /ORGANISM="Entomoneis sp., Strain CCMP2396" /LENGTH=193 /DNA_ID=CAMNT_0043806317 /DNA_START=65 /DNA_END=646 /DNA_ORIENTATION=-